MGPEHIASEDLAKMATWAEDSLVYARGHGQRELARLLGAVRADVEFGRALLAVPSGEHLGPARGEAARNDERRTGKADDVRKQEREEQKHRARLAAWELFKDGERRELELRKGGQLGRLLGEALPGESPAVLRRLADEDQRQAEVGLVALMSTGKVHYKHIDELSPNDMPARVAANRSRTMWLKERRDGWLARRPGGRA